MKRRWLLKHFRGRSEMQYVAACRKITLIALLATAALRAPAGGASNARQEKAAAHRAGAAPPPSVGMASPAGQTSASAVGRVLVNIRPAVRVDLPQDAVVADHQTGDLAVTLTFNVEANSQDVGLFVEASDLHLGDDPATADPVKLKASAPPRIVPQYARPLDQSGGSAAWEAPGVPVGGFSTTAGRQVRFESFQPGRFSQGVDVTVVWDQDDPRKTPGQYGGRVRLTVLVTP